jgi:hypothetical protein
VGRETKKYARALLLAGVCVTSLKPAVALAAQPPPNLQPIVDRNFTIDIHEGVVFGSPRLVAMGGAAFAIGEGATGLFTNPAAAAVRPTKPTGKFEWSAFFNSYVPATGVDFNNNGDPTNEYRRAAVYAPGLIMQLGPWGMALNFGYSRYEVAPQAGGGLGVRSLVPHLSVARHVERARMTFGAGLRGALLNVYTREDSNGLFTQAGVSAELGTVWQPESVNLRLALSGALPIRTGAIQTGCDPLNCFGYILPTNAAAPWILVLGSGYRFGASKWNQTIDEQFRDEYQLTLGLDLMIVGALANAYSIEEFAAKRLQPSGAATTYSPHAGVEAEVIPGWLRLRAGSYFEPSRYPDVDGRMHATGGFEVRLFGFKLGQERRVSIQVAGDVAARYHNIGFSVGFWN